MNIAGMRWKVIENSISNAFELAMASCATYNRMCHASHAGLISQDASLDAAAS